MVRGLDELGMHTATLVVNQMHAAPCTRAEIEGLPVAEVQPGSATSPARGRAARATPDAATVLSEIVARATEEIGWAEINASHVERLAAKITAPLVKLPYVFNEEFGADEVCRLGRVLAEQLDAASSPGPSSTAPGPRSRGGGR
jgi:hypothetical protein